MMMKYTHLSRLPLIVTAVITLLPLSLQAKNPIRSDFFNTYPDAVNSLLYDATTSETHPHCGVCHYAFSGGGPRNPYGAAVEAERASNGKDSVAAFLAIESEDSDLDGYSNIDEITNSAISPYSPTFPGYSAANDDLITQVSLGEISTNLTPSTGADTDPPVVTVTSPGSGVIATGNAPYLIEWTADDGAGSGIASFEIYLSLDGGSSYTHIAAPLLGPNHSNYTWFVSNRPATNAILLVEAYDNSDNEGYGYSDVFEIVSPHAFPSTLRDFDQPGTQPIEESGLSQADPASCAQCHGDYSEAHEPYRNWLGSMMAHASHDPIFQANLTIAQQDAPDSGDLCLRCHNSRGWLDGRSTPTDGSQMTADDFIGVSCDLCHRLVDPVYDPGFSPAIDTNILADLESVPQHFGNGMYVFDPDSKRRGPFDDTISPHTDLHSPFHRESAICGTCHDVSNPVFVRDGDNAEYVANTFDAPATNFSPEVLVPVERTYSEWEHSAYNSPEGVFAPQFAGNKSGYMVASCQDCHMRDILGHGADPEQYAVALRPDMPLHDMTGGSSWLLKVLPTVTNFPYGVGTAEAAAMTNGAERVDYMLRKAARMSAVQEGDNLNVEVINDTGHKLPTGYPEGRRMWINVRFYDAATNLLAEHGGYDYDTGVLTKDTRVYEVHPGIGTNLFNTLTNLNRQLDIDEPGPSFHFVLNNSEFDAFGGAPVGHHYDDGQYWDNTLYAIPEGAESAHVRLYYQSTSKEFMDFLRSENTTDNLGTNVYNLWVENDRCPPVLMTEAWWPENFTIQSIGMVDGDKMGISFNSVSGYTYWVEFADALGSNTFWQPFESNRWIEAHGSPTVVTDDFTTATSGSSPTNGARFYRIMR
jgi:hypothetical protein